MRSRRQVLVQRFCRRVVTFLFLVSLRPILRFFHRLPMDWIVGLLRIERLNLPAKGQHSKFMDAARWEAARNEFAWASALCLGIDWGWNVMVRVRRHEDALSRVGLLRGHSKNDCLRFIALDSHQLTGDGPRTRWWQRNRNRAWRVAKQEHSLTNLRRIGQARVFVGRLYLPRHNLLPNVVTRETSDGTVLELVV